MTDETNGSLPPDRVAPADPELSPDQVAPSAPEPPLALPIEAPAPPTLELPLDEATLPGGDDGRRQRPPALQEAFWGYNDLLIFLGAAFLALLLGAGLVKGVFLLFRLHPSTQTIELISAQLVGYLLMFGALAAVFRMWYGRPFWRSLGWKPLRIPFSVIMIAGMATGIVVALGAGLIHVPDTPNPLTDLMEGRTAMILMAIFGVTIAPIAEELAFRGFLQPLLVRSLGPALGILLTAIPFGLLHFQEYGDSWTHVVLICFAGAAFGLMRHLTGSTKASALMHASYNLLFFIALFSSGKDFHR